VLTDDRSAIAMFCRGGSPFHLAIGSSEPDDGRLGIHVQTVENRRTCACCRPHGLPCLPVHSGKASRCRRTRCGSRWQTRKEVRAHQSRRRVFLPLKFSRIKWRKISISPCPARHRFGTYVAPRDVITNTNDFGVSTIRVKSDHL
jgi:hypothetical protein